MILEQKMNLAHKMAECILYCNYCFNACLEEEDVKMMKECIRLDKECVQVCQATLGLLYKKSQSVKEMLALCEKICRACAQECGKHHYEHCKQCAKACEECAKACNDFANMLK